MFINYYQCPDCSKEWTDVWSATCDDTCPHCGFRNVSPYESTDETVDDYEDAPKRGKVSKPSKPQGSLTNHLRSVRSNRDGAHKRSSRLNKEK